MGKQFISEVKRLQKLAGINEARIVPVSMSHKAEIYPYKASEDTKALYDKIATRIYLLISTISKKLEIPQSDIRISCDGLWAGSNYEKYGLAVQIKANNDTWEKPWNGNNLLVQTPDTNGIVIHSGLNNMGKIDIEGNKNKELRNIYNKALDLGIEKDVVNFNSKLAQLLTQEEQKLIAPNTPIVITGK